MVHVYGYWGASRKTICLFETRILFISSISFPLFRTTKPGSAFWVFDPYSQLKRMRIRNHLALWIFCFEIGLGERNYFFSVLRQVETTNLPTALRSTGVIESRKLVKVGTGTSLFSFTNAYHNCLKQCCGSVIISFGSYLDIFVVIDKNMLSNWSVLWNRNRNRNRRNRNFLTSGTGTVTGTVTC